MLSVNKERLDRGSLSHVKQLLETDAMSTRTWDQMADDKVLALGNYGWGDKSDFGRPSKRAKAVQTVCRQLPDDMYERLKNGMKDRVWFTPPMGLGGTTKNLPFQKMIYISPIWEAAPDELVEYVVLHEMLHVIQGHRLSLNVNDDTERQLNENQEQEVDRLVVELGFQDKRSQASEFIAEIKAKLGVTP